MRLDQWREKDATRAAVRIAVQDFLNSDISGLPAPAYTVADVDLRTDAIFQHVFDAYTTVPSPIYAG